MKIKKLSFFTRLFYSWNQLENYFWTEYSQAGMIADDQLDIIQKQNTTLETENDKLQKQVDKLQDYQIENIELETKLAELRKHKAEIENKFAKPFNYLEQMNKTFFATDSESKGKLGEAQIENIISKSGIASKYWTKKLPVGNNVVEFAFKSDDKWIPIDSKVLEAEVDKNNQIIIDKKYITRVKGKVKEIKKYLSKPNTHSYGILVLQSDAIFRVINDKFPNVYNEIRDDNVLLTSPASFIQLCLSIVPLTKTYEINEKGTKLLDVIIRQYNKITDFINSIKTAQKAINTGMDKHFPAIENHQKKLGKELEDVKKVKKLK